MEEKIWYLYILECNDGTLYTGITDHVPRRLEQHNTGKGAKYTRGREPLVLRYQETCGTHSQALRREIQVKRMTKSEKAELCAAWSQSTHE